MQRSVPLSVPTHPVELRKRTREMSQRNATCILCPPHLSESCTSTIVSRRFTATPSSQESASETPRAAHVRKMVSACNTATNTARILEPHALNTRQLCRLELRNLYTHTARGNTGSWKISTPFEHTKRSRSRRESRDSRIKCTIYAAGITMYKIFFKNVSCTKHICWIH